MWSPLWLTAHLSDSSRIEVAALVFPSFWWCGERRMGGKGKGGLGVECGREEK